MASYGRKLIQHLFKKRPNSPSICYITGLNAEHKQIVTEAIFECLRLGYPLNDMEISGKVRELLRAK